MSTEAKILQILKESKETRLKMHLPYGEMADGLGIYRG
jgi:hypothetical protein